MSSVDEVNEPFEMVPVCTYEHHGNWPPKLSKDPKYGTAVLLEGMKAVDSGAFHTQEIEELKHQLHIRDQKAQSDLSAKQLEVDNKDKQLQTATEQIKSINATKRDDIKKAEEQVAAVCASTVHKNDEKHNDELKSLRQLMEQARSDLQKREEHAQINSEKRTNRFDCSPNNMSWSVNGLLVKNSTNFNKKMNKSEVTCKKEKSNHGLTWKKRTK